MIVASKVGIWNLSLSRIKSSALIQSDTEESTERRAFDAVYDTSLQAVLELFDWHFARKQSSLAQLAEDPPDGWTYRYTYPTDCLADRYLAVRSTLDAIPYEVYLSTDGSTKNIFTDISPAILVYTANITNPNLFSALFIEMLSWKLGAEVGPSLGASVKNIKNAEEKFVTATNQASVHSIKSGEDRAERDAPQIEARS